MQKCSLRIGSVLLTEHCRTDDLLTDLPVPCLPPRHVECGLQSSGAERHRRSFSAMRLLQSDDSRSAAETTRLWSSSWADRARCPKNFSREHFYARQHICYSAYMLSQVRPSVRLSDRCIIEKWLKLGLCNFHHTIAPSL